MFTCAHCHRPSREATDNAPAERPVRVVVETRRRVYPSGSEGHEIVREMMVHERCADAARGT